MRPKSLRLLLWSCQGAGRVSLRYGRVTPNDPGGHVIEYNAGKVIGTKISGAPTSAIKINVRGGVIQTAFPY